MPFLERLSRRFFRKIQGADDLEQDINPADVKAFDKVCPKQRFVNAVRTRLRLGPFAEFLRQPAVVSVRPHAVGQTFRVHETLHAGMHGLDIQISPGKQFSQGGSFWWGFRVQGKVHAAHVDCIIPLQSLNTPGTEITPGSHVIGEDFQ